MEAAKATVASIRTRVGQIRKALERKDLWAIDHAVTQLSEAADTLEHALKSNLDALSRLSERKGGPTIDDPNRPCCKPDGSCCDFTCGN